MTSKLLAQYEPNGRNMPAIIAEINQDLAAEGITGSQYEREFDARVAAAQRAAEARLDKSIVRIYNLLTDTRIFIKFLAEAVSRGLEGKSLRTFIVAAAKEAFKMNRKDANRFIEVGFEAEPVQRAEMAGAFAGQDEFPENDEFLSMAGVPSSRATTVFDDEEAGERKEVEEEDDDEEEEEEAPGGAAAAVAAQPIPRGVPLSINGISLITGENRDFFYSQFAPAFRPLTDGEKASARGHFRDNVNNRGMTPLESMRDTVAWADGMYN
jgi:hypothetical protein